MFTLKPGPQGIPVVNGRIEVSTTKEAEPRVSLYAVEDDANRTDLLLTASQARILIATLKQALKDLEA